MKSRKQNEAKRTKVKPQIETLAYWKGRLRVAKRKYDRGATPIKAEDLQFCEQMVRKIERYVLR